MCFVFLFFVFNLFHIEKRVGERKQRLFPVSHTGDGERCSERSGADQSMQKCFSFDGQNGIEIACELSLFFMPQIGRHQLPPQIPRASPCTCQRLVKTQRAGLVQRPKMFFSSRFS